MENKKIKVCLYLEFYNFWNGVLFRKIGTGLLSSYKNQKTMLNSIGVPFTEKWDSSCDILQINTPWLKSIYLIKKARRQGKKIVIWAHVTKEDAMQAFRFVPIVAPIFKKYLTYAYGLADIVFCPSEYTKSLLAAYGIPVNKLVVQSNGVDVKKFYEDVDKRNSGKKRYELKNVAVGTVGLIMWRKGIDTFLSLAKKFKDANFIWYGKIYNNPILVKPLPKNLSPNVKFTGYVDDALEAFNSLDIFIFPSYEENEGMVILEAAAVGLPILVRDIPVYNGWLEHDKNCLKAKNNEEFEKYLELLMKDEGLRKRLGANAKILAKEKNIEAMSGKLMDAYQCLLGIG